MLARRPCIYTIHNFLPGNLGRWARRGAIWIEEMLSGITKSIIAVSGALKNHATLGLGIDPHKIRIIYNGIHLPEKIREDQDIKRMWGIDKGEKLVGTVARLIPAKGLDVLIDAVPMVLREFPDTKFMIVGDGPVKSALVAKASNLKCDKHYICWTQRIYMVLLWAFDIFAPILIRGLVLPFGSILHGQAGNCFGYRWNKEIVKHNRNGYLVSPGNSRELANAILFYLENPYQADEYASIGRTEIMEKFPLETMINETSRVILEVIDKQYSGC